MSKYLWLYYLCPSSYPLLSPVGYNKLPTKINYLCLDSLSLY
nr:MAG TPA: hypothetical protein [Crassvirales sp.]DAR01907.1 MAG TPA: hypothetical protein [Crassvirales sp.]